MEVFSLMCYHPLYPSYSCTTLLPPSVGTVCSPDAAREDHMPWQCMKVPRGRDSGWERGEESRTGNP